MKDNRKLVCEVYHTHIDLKYSEYNDIIYRTRNGYRAKSHLPHAYIEWWNRGRSNWTNEYTGRIDEDSI